jgi:plastocyanin
MRMRLLKASALVVGLAAVSGCGGSSTATAPSPATTPTINIMGQNGTQAFSPNPAPFAGQQVVFKNSHGVTHHILLNDSSVDLGDIAPGATSRVLTMPASGANYHCSIHPGMIGSVGAASGAPPPACVGPYCDGY